MSILAKFRILIITAASIVVIGVQAGFAQPTEAQRATMRSACPSDYRKYCASIPPGGEASLKCLQENVAKLGDACKSAVEAVGGPAAPAGDQSQSTTPPAANTTAKTATSKPDASATDSASASTTTSASSTESAVTASVPAATAIPAAPAENTAKVHPMTLRQELVLVRHTCGPDYRRLCGGVRLGGGHAVGCLREKAASLSQHCKAALLEVRTQ